MHKAANSAIIYMAKISDSRSEHSGSYSQTSSSKLAVVERHGPVEDLYALLGFVY